MSANPFIYFSGDSYMAGDELADDMLQCWKDMFGGYQPYMHAYQRALIDAKYAEFLGAKMKETDHWTIQQRASFHQCMQDRHWTTIVCDKHGIKHHNDAINGSSQEAVLHRAVISFDKFERAGNVPTLAIIQLTHPGRVVVYTDSTNDIITSQRSRRRYQLFNITPHRMFDMSFVFNYTGDHHSGAAGQKYCLAHMDVESNIGNIVRWLTTLAITNSYFKEKTGRYPIYLSAMSSHIKSYIKPMEDFVANNTPETTGYASLIHQARLYTIDSNVWNLGHEQHLLCPGGHHTPQTHANFAQFIAPHLLQELNNV